MEIQNMSGLRRMGKGSVYWSRGARARRRREEGDKGGGEGGGREGDTCPEQIVIQKPLFKASGRSSYYIVILSWRRHKKSPKKSE